MPGFSARFQQIRFRFLQTADISRQSEFVVLSDVDDPDNEHELVTQQNDGG